MYVIDDSRGNVKIGRARDPFARMKSIGAGNPGILRLVYFREMSAEQAIRVERKVHRDLRSQKVGKEWFAATALEACASIDRQLTDTPIEGRAWSESESVNGPTRPIALRVSQEMFDRLSMMAAETRRTLPNLLVFRLERVWSGVEAEHAAELKRQGGPYKA